ncbi:MAG: tyrosine-type recombinase/integrase [Gammaproteobacteria bacterium]
MKLEFTEDALDSLPIPERGWQYHHDHGGKKSVKGLALGVGPTASKTFYLYRKIDGRPERIKIGPYPDLSIEKARDRADELNRAIAKGANPAETRREHRAELTLGEAFDEYIERYCKVEGVKRWPEVKAQFDRYLGRVDPTARKPRGRAPSKPDCAVDWSRRKLSSIKPTEVARLHSDIGKAGQRTQANRVVEIVSSLFNRMRKLGLYRGPNPADGIEPYREIKRKRFLQSGELPKFFAALAADDSDTFRDFVTLALLTGARRENVLTMRWSDVDLAESLWRIPDTKNGEPLDVPLVPEAVAILKARKPAEDDADASPYVLPAVRGSGPMAPPKKRWAALLDRAGLDDLRLHDLRRSMGSWQAKTGASLIVIGKSLGHKSASATQVYAHLDVDPVRESMEKAAGAMLTAGGLKPAKAKRTRKNRPTTA